MATNPMQRKARNSFLLGMLVTVLIAGIAIAILLMQLMKLKEEENNRVANLKTVYVLGQDVKSGDNLSNVGLTSVTIEKEAVPANAISSGNITEKTVSKIDLSKGTILTSAMVAESGTETTGDLRVQEYNMLKLSSQLTTGEYIDVRLRMPSGLDYIVVSKKQVEIPIVDGVDSQNTIWIKMTEDETLLMSNAIVEAYIMDGAILYTATYVEPGMQEQAIPTYVPTANVQYLMQSDPNITKTASNALISRYNDNVSSRNNINNELSGFSDTRADSISEGVTTEVTTAKDQRQSYLDALSGNN